MNQNKKPNTVLKYGVYSAGMTGIVLAIIIVINLIAGQLDLKFDLTRDKLYSLSEQTYTIADELKKQVNIYALYETGKEDITTKQIFDKYKEASSFITTEFIDPYLNPQIVKKYAKAGEELPVGTVIVECGSKYRVIPMSEMATYKVDPTTGRERMETLNIESSITGAISYVVNDENSKLYLLTGHEESPLDDELLNQLAYENYDIMELDLISAGVMPKDMDILMINSPVKDISADELKLIKDYLTGNGRAIINMGISAVPMPNLTELLGYYGVEVNHAMTIEGDGNYVYQNNPYNLIPVYGEHEITAPLAEKNQRVFFPYSQGINELSTKRSSLTVSPLLTTSKASYGKKQIADIQDFAKAEGDLDGPFSLAVAIKDEWFTEDMNTTKIVVFGGRPLIDTQINSVVNGSNFNFFMNCMNWLQDKSDKITVRPKTIQANTYLQMNQTQAVVIMVFSVIILPVILFGVGIVVMLRRKNK